MRFKQLLTKTLLVAAMLGVGSMSAWADIVETYNFYDFVGAGLSSNPGPVSLGADSHTHAKSGTVVKIINNPTNSSSVTLDLKGRFAADPAYNAGKMSGLGWRNNGTAQQRGLVGYWSSKAPSSGYYALSILNLNTDDEVTITYSLKNATTPKLKFATANAKVKNGSAVAVDDDITSGTTYVITTGGALDIYETNDNFGIHSIAIKLNITPYTTRMAEAKSTGTGLSSSVMNSTVKSALTSALNSEYVDMAASSITSENFDSYVAAIEALETANAAAQTSINNFIILNNLIGNSKPAGYVAPSGAETVYTSDADVDPVALAASVRAAAITAGTANENTDISAVIANNGFELNSTLGWNVATVGDNDNYVIESGNINSTGNYLFYTNPNGNTVSQAIGTLPAGKYEIAADVASWGATMYLIMNSTHSEGNVVGSGGYASDNIKYTFTLAEATPVTIGINAANGTYVEGGGAWGYRLDNFTLTYIDDDPLGQAQAALIAEIETATELRDSWTNKVGTAPFKYDATYYNALVEAIKDAQDVIDENGNDEDDYTDAKDALVDAEDNMASSVLNEPDENKYYRLYIADNGTSTGLNMNLLRGSTQWMTLSEMPYAVKIVKSGDNYIIKDAYDKYVAAPSNANSDWGTYSSVSMLTDANKWEVTIQNDGTFKMLNHNSTYKGWGWYLGAFGKTEDVRVSPYFYKTSPTYTTWLCSEPVEVTDVTLSVNATAGWGTFIAPYDNLTPSTVKAYTVSYTENKVVYFTENETGVLSANTPYILSTEEASDVSTTFKGIANNEEDTYTENGLVGLLTASEVPADSYVLQYNDGVVGFYKTTEAITGTANRCYLDLDDVSTEVPSGARAFVGFGIFGGDTTGINTVKDSQQKTESFYNLSGQRISQPTKGIYIVNGKKVVVK